MSPFRKCFSRTNCFKWFVIVICALMLRSDQLGITSVIRDLNLSHTCYESLLHFFRSKAYKLSALRRQWYKIVAGNAPIHRVAGRAIIIGDGVKQGKEAFRMPGVKKMVQESETCSKPEYIHGHLFGAVGVIISNAGKKFTLPLKLNLQDGLKPVASWPEANDVVEISARSHVDQMIEAGFEVSEILGKVFFLLDRYFLSRSALELLNEKNSRCYDGENQVEIITKAKSNCTAYRHPHRKKGSKGRPPQKGSTVKISQLFSQHRFFKEIQVQMYGKTETVSYYCLNLLWGQGLYRELRFVLVKYNGMKSILVSTDTSLDPATIIELYATRFGIEAFFREFKQQIGGLGYHFWTRFLPKLNHFAKKDTPDPLLSITDAHDRTKIIDAIHAIETFVQCACIAMGITQMISLGGESRDEILKSRYLRTRSNTTPSEATVMHYLRKHLFSLLLHAPESFVTQYIREKQSSINEADNSKTEAEAA